MAATDINEAVAPVSNKASALCLLILTGIYTKGPVSVGAFTPKTHAGGMTIWVLFIVARGWLPGFIRLKGRVQWGPPVHLQTRAGDIAQKPPRAPLRPHG